MLLPDDDVDLLLRMCEDYRSMSTALVASEEIKSLKERLVTYRNTYPELFN